MSCQLFCASVHFDSGNDSRLDENFDKWSAIFLALVDRLVVEDRAANALAKTGCGHDQLAVGAPRFLCLGNPQAGKSFIAGRIAFVHRQQAFVVGEEPRHGLSKRLRFHLCLLRFLLRSGYLNLQWVNISGSSRIPGTQRRRPPENEQVLVAFQLRSDLRIGRFWPADARISSAHFIDDFHRQGFPPIKIVREAMLGDDSPTL